MQHSFRDSHLPSVIFTLEIFFDLLVVVFILWVVVFAITSLIINTSNNNSFVNSLEKIKFRTIQLCIYYIMRNTFYLYKEVSPDTMENLESDKESIENIVGREELNVSCSVI